MEVAQVCHDQGFSGILHFTRFTELCCRVSQEFFQTMATPKFSAFGYLNMEFIEKNKIYKI